LTDQKHYPALFNLIPKWLDEQPAKGNVFLVGAGGLGKVYCNWIKQRGGVAIDMGSILDGWAGLITRSYLKEMNIAL
jgi:hypothetical protein